MKIASEFRLAAREALKNKWGLAVGVGVVASILGASTDGGPLNIKIDIELPSSTTPETAFPTWEQIRELLLNIPSFLFGFGAFVFFLGLMTGIAYFILGRIIGVGYAKFNLNLIDGHQAGFNDLFAHFSSWKQIAISGLLRALYVFLWSLLFVIPGIIASYSYAMTDYLLAKDSELSASEAIERSKVLMSGNRWRLFCLHLSFIGWDILCVLFTFGIGYLWLTPYKQAAVADFYREISDTRPAPEPPLEPQPLPEA